MKSQEPLSAKDRELLDAYEEACDKMEVALRAKLRKLKAARVRFGKVQETLDLIKKHPENIWFQKALEAEMAGFHAVPYVSLDSDVVFVQPGQEIEVWISGKKF